MSASTGMKDAYPMDFGRRTYVVRRAGIALRWSRRTAGVCALLVAATLAISLWSVMSGSYELTLGQVWATLTGDPEAAFARVVLLEWRLPRALAAVVFGAALGVAGAVFQSLTRNPLASPDVIGFSTGSYTGALVVILVTGGTHLQVAGGALVGGFVTAAAVYLLAWRRGVHGFRMIIVGIALSAMLTSVNTWLIMTAELEAAITAAVWGTGSLNGTTWEHVAVGSAIVLVLLALLTPLAAGLRQLELGDDAAKATGTRTEPVRLAVIAIGVALTATATASAGIIAFVALAAPQIGRNLVRAPGVPIAAAACTGAFLLATADHAAQHLLPVDLPVGVVTVVVGGGYLVWLLVHESRRRT